MLMKRGFVPFTRIQHLRIVTNLVPKSVEAVLDPDAFFGQLGFCVFSKPHLIKHHLFQQHHMSPIETTRSNWNHPCKIFHRFKTQSPTKKWEQQAARNESSEKGFAELRGKVKSVGVFESWLVHHRKTLYRKF